MKELGKELVVVNTHFDLDVEEARYEVSKLIMERISSIEKKLPIFLMEDFDETKQGRWYKMNS